MSDILQHLKAIAQANFGSAMFLLVVGTIALAFIGYLLIDYFRTTITMFRNKRRHRREHHHS